MPLRQQFLYRVDHRHRETLGAEYAFHDGDGELLATADNRRVHAVRALPQQRYAVQHLLQLGELLIDQGLQAIVFETWQSLRQAAQQVGEDALRIAHIWQNVLPGHRFFNHRHQVVGDLCRRGQYRGYLSLTCVTFHDVGNAQKTFCIRYRSSAKFQHSHF
ncbi:Uncharacterised protein [Serratia plymuthica]|uniref:Uncharacterized protein n=1 Tax=Serratia plymuthica TaxID=82996 RepID=A0A2X4TW23_SERPL|nr:Uncharacterised protein [Serratia plymuthica]